MSVIETKEPRCKKGKDRRDRGWLFAAPKKDNFNGVNQTGRREEQALPSSNLVGNALRPFIEKETNEEGGEEFVCSIRMVLS